MIILLNDISSMSMNDYKIYRDNIYVGIVTKRIEPIIFFNSNISIDDVKKAGLIIPEMICEYRKILFLNNGEGKSIDLLFKSPNYQIGRHKNTQKNEELYIEDYIYLGNLLKEYKFNQNLSKSDIKKIYNLFLKKDNKFINENHLYLPMSYEDFQKLQFISDFSRYPVVDELENRTNINSFEPKIKIFTKK